MPNPPRAGWANSALKAGRYTSRTYRLAESMSVIPAADRTPLVGANERPRAARIRIISTEPPSANWVPHFAPRRRRVPPPGPYRADNPWRSSPTSQAAVPSSSQKNRTVGGDGPSLRFDPGPAVLMPLPAACGACRDPSLGHRSVLDAAGHRRAIPGVEVPNVLFSGQRITSSTASDKRLSRRPPSGQIPQQLPPGSTDFLPYRLRPRVRGGAEVHRLRPGTRRDSIRGIENPHRGNVHAARAQRNPRIPMKAGRLN